jgi:hypothetical protein
MNHNSEERWTEYHLHMEKGQKQPLYFISINYSHGPAFQLTDIPISCFQISFQIIEHTRYLIIFYSQIEHNTKHIIEANNNNQFVCLQSSFFASTQKRYHIYQLIL